MRPKRVMREWGVGRKGSEGKEKREAGRRGGQREAVGIRTGIGADRLTGRAVYWQRI